MKSSLQTPKPLTKSKSRENSTPAFTSLPSHVKTSDLSSSAIPRHQKIRPKSLDTDFMAASEHLLSDLPDPLMISGESGLSSITVEEKLISNSDCLAGSENNLPDLSHLAMSSASSSTSEYSAQKPLSYGPKANAESLNKGKGERVISASDLLKKALAEISGSKDITDDTKKIMDAMFEAAVQQLEGGQIGESTVRLTNPVFMAKLRIAFLLLVILFLAVRLLLKFWFVGDQDWPYGLTPT
ncbi:uncharacterized protein LOC144543618 [Carex rostrata]